MDILIVLGILDVMDPGYYIGILEILDRGRTKKKSSLSVRISPIVEKKKVLFVTKADGSAAAVVVT